MKSEFEKLGYKVIGISKDSVKKQQNFIEKRNLTVNIIADIDEELCNYFEVIQEKNIFGKIGLGIVRTTVVLDEDFKVIKRYDKVKVKDHAKQVLSDLSE